MLTWSGRIVAQADPVRSRAANRRMERAELERDFEAMAARTGPRALEIVRALVGTRAAAEDAVQEAFEKAYRRLGSFRGEAAMSTWFLRIAINTALRHARRRRWLRPAATADSQDRGEIETTSDEPSPEQHIGAAQIRRRLDAAIRTLPARQRTAFVLRYVQGMSTEKTADLMECAPGTVKAALHKAVTRLRRQLKDLWAEESP